VVRHILFSLLLTGIVALLLGACSDIVPSSSDDLEDTNWVLESYGEPGNLNVVLDGTEITATFDSAAKRVSGSAGANTYSGSYEITHDELSISGLAWTEMYRLEPVGVMEQEQRYLQLFIEAESFQIDDGELRIYSRDEVLIYNNRGILQGKVTIGPISPVEKPGKTTVVPCEVYQARKIMVYDGTGGDLVAEVEIDCEGKYLLRLKPGTYTVDINRIGIDSSSEVPVKIEITAGLTYRLDIDIDTGIR